MKIFGSHIQEAINKRMRIPQSEQEMNENIETISEPGSPQRASMPMARDDDGIFLQDTLLLERRMEL